ncbi:VOC family protein [Rehaibacterium terrae]|jgi:glyoxylase I family protein|uniref:Glyoxylase I family protein n=1 Tax=Rehaibacterium terrae TaxID=1341696 RepID=A0A7W8DER2_9GAMM|nr:VOC family protein [Rehaibacterium terrae]MBB5015634.1 glyoxylase I family protein [Rehaibacterium terrae]
MFRVLGIDHVVLRARDPRALVRFYVEALGCPVEREQPDLGLIQLCAGRALIDIVDVAGAIGRAGGAPPGEEGRNLDHLCLRIEPWDLDALRAHLVAHGARLGEYGQRYGAEGRGPSLYLYDPEGNLLELKGPASASA